ncbi:MAG: DUF4388 domain-containing protein [Chitinispirillia bacterium]
MGPKRVAFFIFITILHFSVFSYSTQTPQTDSSSTDKEKDRQIFQKIEEKIGEISGKSVQIKSSNTNVLKDPDPKSEIIGRANKGKHYPLLKEGDVWCRIRLKNQEGWIERQYVNIVDTPLSPSFLNKKQIINIAVIFVVVILIWLVYHLSNKKNQLKTEWFLTKQIQKKVLIVSNKETLVTRHLTNTTTVMEKCFKETGFEVQTAKDTIVASKLIFQYLPDAIVVDWQLGDKTQTELENILSSKSITSNIFVLFYNIPDLSKIKRSKIIRNTHYLAHSFNDRDLFNIITPLIITGEKKQAITKSVETSALQGNVEDSRVSEVFQFVEIGKKTGCLLVEDRKPSGIVYFKDGIIIYAKTKNNRGQKAVFEILSFDRGQFVFVLDKKPKAPNCSIPTLGILMEWTRINDENIRNRLRKT